MSDFARLETHDGLQVLCFVKATENDDKYGPCVITRCDPSVSVDITEGPWSRHSDHVAEVLGDRLPLQADAGVAAMTATLHPFPRRVPVGRAVLLAGHPRVIDLRTVYEADLAVALGEETPPPPKGWWAKLMGRV